MRFGRTLRESIYPEWKDHYIDYDKLKGLLREDAAEEDGSPWTDEDDNRFSDEILNVQLDKVAKFQRDKFSELRDGVDGIFEELKRVAPGPDGDGEGEGDGDGDGKGKGKSKGKSKARSGLTTELVQDIGKQVDKITSEVRELKKYSNLNYTGFLKIVKKHDRRRGGEYRLGPFLKTRLAQNPFNSDKDYSPLLTKLSLVYEAIHQYLDDEARAVRLDGDGQPEPEIHDGERYTAHKFWVHPDNLLEVKTMILPRLPALVYSKSSAKELDAHTDPTLTSLYLDNAKFELYTAKEERAPDAASLRLRWYGDLSAKPDIFLEQKAVHDNGVSEDYRFIIKDKYVKPFLDGEYRMEKTVQKMERQGDPAEDIEAFQATAASMQDFVRSKHLQPLLRANYVRTAYQKPADDRVRISIDTDLAFVREDTLDQRRPCRDPAEWHRRDIDNRNMSYPFADISRSDIYLFPYAVLEIKLKDDGSGRKPGWIEDDLMKSHLLYPAPRFSKFLLGVATLFDDYVNNLPFWLSEIDKDILQDPQRVFDQEEQRKAKRAEDEFVVGSALGTMPSSFKPAKSSPVGRSDMAAAAAAAAASSTPMSSNGLARHDRESTATEQRRGYGTTSSSVLPSFSLSRYAKWRRGREGALLPEGVVEPTSWMKNAGPLQVEPKVWLANERTFLKWQHTCVLLGSVALAVFMAAAGDVVAEAVAIALVAISAFAGFWGWYMLQTRRAMIMERSGKDFDNMFGPLVIAVALMVALILNFVFAYRAAFDRWNHDAAHPGALNSSARPFDAASELL